MTTLPEFDPSNGYLPPGIHAATPDAIRARCVDEHYFTKDHRARMFAGYERLVEALMLAGVPTEQWLGGSFVQRRGTPDDIDLVNFCDPFAYEALHPDLKALLQQYFKGNETARHCHCDSYFVPLPPPEHQLLDEFQIVRQYWHNQLGHDVVGRPKGIIARSVDPAAAQETDADDPAA